MGQAGPLLEVGGGLQGARIAPDLLAFLLMRIDVAGGLFQPALVADVLGLPVQQTRPNPWRPPAKARPLCRWYAP